MAFFVNLLVLLGIVGAGVVLVEGTKETSKDNASNGEAKPEVRLNENGYEIDEQGRFIHRLVSAAHDGPIPRGWVVHHCDGKKRNNHPGNLCQMPAKYHDDLHLYMRQNRRYFNKNEIIARMKVEGIHRPRC